MAEDATTLAYGNIPHTYCPSGASPSRAEPSSDLAEAETLLGAVQQSLSAAAAGVVIVVDLAAHAHSGCRGE